MFFPENARLSICSRNNRLVFYCCLDLDCFFCFRTFDSVQQLDPCLALITANPYGPGKLYLHRALQSTPSPIYADKCSKREHIQNKTTTTTTTTMTRSLDWVHIANFVCPSQQAMAEQSTGLLKLWETQELGLLERHGLHERCLQSTMGREIHNR